MKNSLLRFALFSALLAILCIHPLKAADLEAMEKSPAVVSVLNMKPMELKPGEGRGAWAKVPQEFSKRKAVIFTPDGGVNGVADITVMEEGWIFIAVNYDNQGSGAGDWEQEVWTLRNFKSKGWNQFSSRELGGDLVKSDGRVQTIFAKRLKKGTTERIRCNKYDPPFVIILNKAS